MGLFSLFFNKNIIIIGLSVLTISYLAFNLKLSNEKLKNAELNLQNTININKKLYNEITRQKERYELENKTLLEAIKEKNEIKDKVVNVKEYVYMEYKSGENNITKLFNVMVNRLWDDKNADSK